jgi:hypothetical protein
MDDLDYLKSRFRIFIDKIKKKKQVSQDTEDLCWLFFLAGYKSGGESSLVENK